MKHIALTLLALLIAVSAFPRVNTVSAPRQDCPAPLAPAKVSKEELQIQLDAIGEKVKILQDELIKNRTKAEEMNTRMNARPALDKLMALMVMIANLETEVHELKKYLQVTQPSDYDNVASEMAVLEAEINSVVVQLNDLSDYLNVLEEKYQINQQDLKVAEASFSDFVAAFNAAEERFYELTNQVGHDFFMLKPTEQMGQKLDRDVAINDSLGKQYNIVATRLLTLKFDTKLTVEEFSAECKSISYMIDEMHVMLNGLVNDIYGFEAQVPTLSVNVPDRSEWWSLKLKDQALPSLKVGWKSGHGIVLTSTGCLFFEQVQGCDVRLMDSNGLYIKIDMANGDLAETNRIDEATVWTGKRTLIDGQSCYSFYSAKDGLWLTTEGIGTYSSVVTWTEETFWTIEEGDDSLQLSLYGMMEENDSEPMIFDLNGMTDYLRHPLVVPPNIDVTFRNGAILPREGLVWSYDTFIELSDSSKLKLENIEVGLGDEKHYADEATKKIAIFKLWYRCVLHLGHDTKVLAPSFSQVSYETEDYPGGVILTYYSTSKILLDGCELTGTIFEQVSQGAPVCIVAPLLSEVNIFVPLFARDRDNTLARSENGYTVTVADLSKINLLGAPDFTPDVRYGYIYLLPISELGDINGSGAPEMGDMQRMMFMIGGITQPTKRADLNGDGAITPADLQLMIERVARKATIKP